jgi:1-acyl-sn-glycerol-3-phosphate acyltransferase
MRNYVVLLLQLITWLPFRVILMFMYNPKVNYHFKFEKGKHYVIASNHPNRLDPFLVCYLIPLRDTLRLVPYRFITADKYMKNIFLGSILMLFGCITTRETKSGSILKRAIRLIERGETVYIFPSGTLERKKKKYDARIGVAYLGKHAKNTEIIPVHINYSRKNHNGVEITFKKSVKVNSKVKDLRKEAEKVYSNCLS